MILKKLCFSIYLLFLIVSSALSQGSKINIAVLDLDPTNISNQDAQFLSDRLRAELFETGMFRVVERDRMKDILSEQGFQLSGCTTIECAVEVGQLLNVQQMVAGNIGQLEELYSISLRLIDVQTGAIIQTATRDYRGKLSNVLTQIIPQVAGQLAKAEKSVTKKPTVTKTEDKKIDDEGTYSKFSILLKGGLAGLNFTGDLNEVIQEFNTFESDTFGVADADEYSGFNNFGLELQYALSARLALKFGLSAQNMLSEWYYEEGDYENEEHVYEVLELTRKYSFINIYIGINYKFWYSPDKFAFHLGTDIGAMRLGDQIIQYYLKDGIDYDFDNSYDHTAFAIKLSFGFSYYFGSHFILGTEFSGQYTSKYSTAVEEDSAFDYFPWEFGDIVYPEEINGTGLQLNLILGYRF